MWTLLLAESDRVRLFQASIHSRMDHVAYEAADGQAGAISHCREYGIHLTVIDVLWASNAYDVPNAFGTVLAWHPAIPIHSSIRIPSHETISRHAFSSRPCSRPSLA
jgi:hypothetical protein